MSHMLYFPEWFTHICGLHREQAHWGAETVQQAKELREPELSDTSEPIIEQQKEEKVGEISPP